MAARTRAILRIQISPLMCANVKQVERLCCLSYPNYPLTLFGERKVSRQQLPIIGHAWALGGLHRAADVSAHDARRRIGPTARFRVTFAKELMGLRFPIASVEVRRTRNADWARRVAELRFNRRYGMSWRMRANVEELEAV